MRYTYRHIGILTISLIVASCSFSQKQADNNHDKDMNPNVKIVVLDPGHFHASLLQKNPLASVNDTIRGICSRRSGSQTISERHK